MRLLMRALMVAMICAAAFAAGSGGALAAPIGNGSGDLAATVRLHTPSLAEPVRHHRHYRHYRRYHHHHHRRYYRYYYYRYCHWHRHRHHYHYVCHY